ncbi:MAG: antibiotic biosynthesis monooxygenase [Candidatus Eremiobacteraeota bacterium]|nr:antibiotic biosynthesis monooxygenase [Candidatus Eremiobacteraeota bacterium]
MITVANRIPVKPEYHDKFEEAFQKRLGLVDDMPGFVAYRLLRPSKEEDPYVVLTFWESEDHFRQWTQSENFREQHKKDRMLADDAFAGKVNLEIHEVVQESGAPFKL